jgi:mono/diheme cytochrome c family protein
MTTTPTHESASPAPEGQTLAAVLAEYASPQAITSAVRAVRAAGFTRLDAHTPFPFHELDAALGIGKTRLPWFTLAAAAVGGGGAFAMQYWMNGVDYPFLISGKPIVSLPSKMPVIFACAVLLASITTLVAMLLLNGLPRWSNPVFSSDRFRRSTNDRFFLTVDARDPKFDLAGLTTLLQATGTLGIETCWSRPADAKIPARFAQLAMIVVALLCIPPVIVFRMRATDSREPRIHLIHDMDFQPKFKPQTDNSLFADGRAERPQVLGTIARGDLQADDRLYRGLEDGTPLLATTPVSLQAATDGAAPADGGVPVDPLDKLPWITAFPMPIDVAVMKRGQERYNIYCATCHGLVGDGDGLITQRALELEQGTWVKPVSFHADTIRTQPVGRLFHSITNGVRKMPPMGDLVPVEDRWAILLYLRALQRARNADVQDVPADLLPQLDAQ